jgi:hypothetical protein
MVMAQGRNDAGTESFFNGVNHGRVIDETLNISRANVIHRRSDRSQGGLRCSLRGVALFGLRQQPFSFGFALPRGAAVTALRQPSGETAQKQTCRKRNEQQDEQRNLPGQRAAARIERVDSEGHGAAVGDRKGHKNNCQRHKYENGNYPAQHALPFTVGGFGL